MQDPAEQKAADDLGWARLAAVLASEAVSEGGRALLLGLSPHVTLEEAKLRATLARSALSLLAAETPVPRVALADVSEVVLRLERGAPATGTELRDVTLLLGAARVLRAFTSAHEAAHPAFSRELATDRALAGLEDELRAAIDDGGEVMDRASPALAHARRRAQDARRELHARLTELLARHAEVLRDRFYTERDGRYVLPVRADAHFRFDGVVLGSSGSGSTLYVEPRETTELSNRRHLAEAEVEREVAKVLAALSLSARLHAGAIRDAAGKTARADALGALSQWARKVDAVPLFVDEAAVLDLRAIRHPLLVRDGVDVVPNDIRLGASGCLVISGPNAGGKTVALKCLGLAAWMARAGIPVPADPRSRIGYFDTLLTDIGDEQSLERSLSTFSAHAARLASYLAVASPRTLILLDEVAAGTDPDEGAALAAAVLEALVERGAAVAVTTHYERLKQLAGEDPRFENASVGFDFESMSPTFRLTLGIPGASSALAVAARYGLPPAVIARAAALLPEENLRRDVLLAEIERDRAKASAERREAEASAREQEELREQAEREIAGAREQERERLRREAALLTTRVREARGALEQATALLRKGSGSASREEVRGLEKEVNRAAREAALGSPVEAALRPAERDFAAPVDVRLGARVFVPRLRALAEVTELLGGGKVKVAAGPLKVVVRADELREPPKGGAPARVAKKAAPRPAPQATDSAPVRTSSNTADVRGLRVDEARDSVDSLLDQLLLQGDPAGFVLHGHGTGALKAALREHLTLHPLVGRARPAEEQDGGDAFTVFWLA